MVHIQACGRALRTTYAMLECAGFGALLCSFSKYSYVCTYIFLPVQTCHPKTNTSNNQEKIHVDLKLGSTTANGVSREEKPSTVNRQPIRNHQPSTLKIIYMKRFQNQAKATHVPTACRRPPAATHPQERKHMRLCAARPPRHFETTNHKKNGMRMHISSHTTTGHSPLPSP